MAFGQPGLEEPEHCSLHLHHLELLEHIQRVWCAEPTPPAIYNAEGTYTYDDVTGVISADFTSSDFLPECDGPPVGAINLDSEIFDEVLSFVTTDGADQYVDFFSRDSGTTGEILGGWDLIGHYADESGSDNFWWNDSASISCVIRSDGTLSMYGMEADCR